MVVAACPSGSSATTKQQERSFSIVSPPEQATVALTVARIDGGEISPYLTEELRVEQAAELFVQLGHEPDAIRTERFGPTG